MLVPNVLKTLSYEQIVDEIKNDFVTKIPCELLESDTTSKLIECFAYREKLQSERINNAVKALLIDYAKESDLDHLALTLYRIKRLEGTKPKAHFSFKLNVAQDSDVVIAKNSVLHSNNYDKAVLLDDVIIKAGEKTGYGECELDIYISYSNIKCELLQTPLPFLIEVKQLDSFSNSAEVESDDAFRQRAKMSVHKFSTAGSANAYIYHAFSADSRVLDAVATDNGNPNGGIAYIYIKAKVQTPELLKIVKNYLNDDDRRPLNAVIELNWANKKEVLVEADVFFDDLALANDFKVPSHNFKIGENYVLSKIYKELEQNGVYKVEINSPLDLSVGKNEYLELVYKINKRAKV